VEDTFKPEFKVITSSVHWNLQQQVQLNQVVVNMC